MASAAVSNSLSNVLLTAGLVVLPIVVDGMTSLVLRHLPIIGVPPRARWVFSSLTTAAAVYRTLGIPQYTLANLISGCLYLAYKVCGYILIQRSESSKMSPTQILIRQKYKELRERLTLTCEVSDPRTLEEFGLEQQAKIREKWSEPETLKLADELIQLAAEDMRNLYQDLEKTASQLTGQKRYEKMAIELISQQKPYFYRRFYNQFSVTLLDIYRMVRGLQFVIKKGDRVGTFYLPELWIYYPEERDRNPDPLDSVPFFTSGSKQDAWRTTHNGVMELYRPIMEELKKFPLELQSDAERYYMTAVQDLEPLIAQYNDSRADVFKLQPAGKPT